MSHCANIFFHFFFTIGSESTWSCEDLWWIALKGIEPLHFSMLFIEFSSCFAGVGSATRTRWAHLHSFEPELGHFVASCSGVPATPRRCDDVQRGPGRMRGGRGGRGWLASGACDPEDVATGEGGRCDQLYHCYQRLGTNINQGPMIFFGCS